MKENDKKYWLQLFELAEKVEKLNPWKYISDSDFVMLSLPNKDGIIYCHAFSDGIEKNIMIVFGGEINTYLDFKVHNYPTYFFNNYNQGLFCIFNFDMEISKITDGIIDLKNELGVKSDTMFLCLEKRYIPYLPDIKQVKLLIEILENYIEAIQILKKKQITPNFENGETIFRAYDKDAKVWTNMLAPMILEPKEYMCIESNEEETEKILKTRRNKMELEVEFLNYTISAVDKNSKAKKKLLSRVFIIADRHSDFIIDCNFIDMRDFKNEEYYVSRCIDSLIELFYNVGRPKIIYVRDEETFAILEEICKSVEIDIEISPKLETIEKQYGEMFDI